MKLLEKEIVEAKSVNEYYMNLPDKRLFECANVLLIDEEERYVLIKNKWKYTQDVTECRDITGKCFNVRDIMFLYLKAREFLDGKSDITAINLENIVIKL